MTEAYKAALKRHQSCAFGTTPYQGGFLSKEIARTVGGKKFAVLLAALALIAVFATVGSRWQRANAMAATDQTVTAHEGQTASVISIDQSVRTEVATAPYAAVSDLTPVDNMRSTPLSAQLDSSQTSSSTRQSSSSAIDMTNKAPGNAWVLGSAGATLSQATSGVSSPGSSPVVAVRKVSGVEYAPYALVGVLAAFATLVLVLAVHRRDQPIFGLSSSLPVKKWGIRERFGAPMRRINKSE